MDMDWLCQLGDGWMIAIGGNGNVVRVKTGYPYPEVSGGQLNRLAEFMDTEDIDLSGCIKVLRGMRFPKKASEVRRRLVENSCCYKNFNERFGRQQVIDNIGDALLAHRDNI